MTSVLLADPTVVAIAGDWHGNLPWAEAQVRRAAEAGADFLVHLGDFGLWSGPTGKKYLLRLNRVLDEVGLDLLFVDGNHEDHDRIASKKIDLETGMRSFASRVHHLPRGRRWQWSGYTWMSLGGAVSVDKRRRRSGRDWWPDETLSPDDVERAVAGGPVDVIVSHDAPAGVHIPGLQPGAWPADVIAEAEAHRSVVRSVVDHTRPRALWHGHYHVHYRDTLDLGWDNARPDWTGVCVVRGLDCDDGHWANNLALANPDGSSIPVAGNG